MRTYCILVTLLACLACAREQPDSDKPPVDSVAASPATVPAPPAPLVADTMPADTVMARDTARAM